MSSSEEEIGDSHREDFVEEFDTYGQNERRKRQKIAQGRQYRKDEALYGVFMEDVGYSKYDANGSSNSRRLNVPVSFVSSSSSKPKSGASESTEEETGSRTKTMTETIHKPETPMGLGFVPSVSSSSSKSAPPGIGFVSASGSDQNESKPPQSSSSAGIGFVSSSFPTSASVGLGFSPTTSNQKDNLKPASSGLGFVSTSLMGESQGENHEVGRAPGLGLGYVTSTRDEGNGTADTHTGETEEEREIKFQRLAKGVDSGSGKTYFKPEYVESNREKEKKNIKQKEKTLKAKPVKLDKNFGAFEKYTKGIGLKYLQKFGFQGRLGKNEQGISAPIAVKVRPKNVGLGLISEANELPENKRLEKELGKSKKKTVKGKGDSDEEDVYRLKTKYDDFDKGLTDLWKKAARSRSRQEGTNKIVYKTASDILNDASSLSKPKASTIKVIDMRGGTPKVLSGLDKMNLSRSSESSSATESESDSSSEDSSSDESLRESRGRSIEPADELDFTIKRYKGIVRGRKKFGQELLFNVKSLVQVAESELRNKHQSQRAHNERKNILEERMKNLEISQNNSASLIQDLSMILNKLTECNKKCLNDEENATTNVMALKTIWTNYGQYIQMFDLDRFAISIADRCTEKWAREYEYRDAIFPERFPSELRKYIDIWKDILPNDLKFNRFLSTTLEQHVVPKVIRIYTNSFERFNTCHDYEVLVKWTTDTISYFNELGFPLLVGAIVDRAVMPKLKSFVNEWNYSLISVGNKYTVPLHVVIHPWLPFLRKSIRENLHRDIRRKLEKAVRTIWKRWNKEEKELPIWEELNSIVTPWQSVFSKGTYDKLIDNAVIPGLEDTLSSLVINPKNQDDRPFQVAIHMKSAIGNDRCACLLVALFFPKWLRVLRKWLMSTDELQQPVQWYSAWKKQFPIDMLRQNIQLRAHFDLAIHWLERKSEKQRILEEAPPAATFESVYTKSEQNYEDDVKRVSVETANQLHHDDFEDYRNSRRVFRDLIQAIAEDKGVTFMRHSNNKQVEGNLVYVLHDSEVYFHETESVLFAKEKDSGKWVPMELEQLL